MEEQLTSLYQQHLNPSTDRTTLSRIGSTMNFIPMGFKQLSDRTFYAMGLEIVLFALITTAIISTDIPVAARWVIAAVGIGAFSVGVFCMVDNIVRGSRARSTQKRDLRSQIKETYGLDLSMEQIDKLEYPEEQPADDRAVFGEVRIIVWGNPDSVLSTQLVSLLWSDKTMVLTNSEESDGLRSYVEIPRLELAAA